MKQKHLVGWAVLAVLVVFAAAILIRGALMDKDTLQREAIAKYFTEVPAQTVDYLNMTFLVFDDPSPGRNREKIFGVIGHTDPTRDFYFFSAFSESAFTNYTYFAYFPKEGKLYRSSSYGLGYYHSSDKPQHPEIYIEQLSRLDSLGIAEAMRMKDYVSFLERIYGFRLSDVYQSSEYYSSVPKEYIHQEGPGGPDRIRYEPSRYFLLIHTSIYDKRDALWLSCSTNLTCYYEKAKEEQPICAKIPLFVDQNATTDGGVIDNCNAWLKANTAYAK
jgi:hypothetical protein